MPNHYDIDVYCEVCGNYMYSYRDDDPKKETMCRKCGKKAAKKKAEKKYGK